MPLGQRSVAVALAEMIDSDDRKKMKSVPKSYGLKADNSGGLRYVYFDRENDVVYKVDQYEDESEWGNASEVRNARYLWGKFPGGIVGEHIRIPRTTGYTVGNRIVVAQEFISGTIGGEVMPSDYGYSRKCNKALWDRTFEARQALFKLGFRDMHPNNFIIDMNEKVWPIDMGSPRYSYDSYPVDNRVFNRDEINRLGLDDD